MLTQLQGLFEKIGPIVKLEMKYDRAGRSEGTAYVVYESHIHAKEAIQEFDGANAAGMLALNSTAKVGQYSNSFQVNRFVLRYCQAARGATRSTQQLFPDDLSQNELRCQEDDRGRSVLAAIMTRKLRAGESTDTAPVDAAAGLAARCRTDVARTDDDLGHVAMVVVGEAAVAVETGAREVSGPPVMAV
jgi:hypothetical protein